MKLAIRRQQLAQIKKNLKIQCKMSEEQLSKEREIIDKIDDSIIDLLVSRYNVVEKIRDLKRTLNLETFSPQREREILNKLENRKHSKHLLEIFNKIMEESRKIQQK